MKLKVTCRISRRIGKDLYEAPPRLPDGTFAKGRVYDVEAERAGKYADYFNFASAEDEAIAQRTFKDRLAADDAAFLARQTPAFTLADLAQAVAKILQPQVEVTARKVQAT